jgi:hypothetical protein
MLTYLSRSIGRILRGARRPQLRLLPSANEIAPLPGARTPPQPNDTFVGASAFVAGQGARIYSLDAFRRRAV